MTDPFATHESADRAVVRPPHRASDAGVYVMSVAADLAGVHPQTLRTYERRGLIEPARSAGGSRLYSDSDLERIRRIGELTGAGVTLEGVRRILELEAELSAVTAELDRLRQAEDDRDRDAGAAT